MKYLARLFASSNNNNNNQQEASSEASSASSASKLYSVTFVAKAISESASSSSSLSLSEANSQILDNQVESSTIGLRQQKAKTNSSQGNTPTDLTSQVSVSFRGCGGIEFADDKEETSATIVVNLNNRHLRENIHSLNQFDNKLEPELVECEVEEDWIIVDSPLEKKVVSSRKVVCEKAKMALDKKDIKLIETSWAPARKDPTSAGILLFKGLFTKFPQYLRFFPQFADLDLENMKDNKRLLRHALKVIETVGFVVEAVGDEKMASHLNSALVNLVSSHLKRNIGSNEFRNLGIVLIDFICEINHKRADSPSEAANNQRQQATDQSSTGGSINQSSNDDSETMTSAMEKLGGSSSTTSSSISSNELTGDKIADIPTTEDTSEQRAEEEEEVEEDSSVSSKLDTGSLVAAWTKLYGNILNLVEQQEEANKLK